jgi:hypothetical protein
MSTTNITAICPPSYSHDNIWFHSDQTRCDLPTNTAINFLYGYTAQLIFILVLHGGRHIFSSLKYRHQIRKQQRRNNNPQKSPIAQGRVNNDLSSWKLDIVTCCCFFPAIWAVPASFAFQDGCYEACSITSIVLFFVAAVIAYDLILFFIYPFLMFQREVLTKLKRNLILWNGFGTVLYATFGITMAFTCRWPVIAGELSVYNGVAACMTYSLWIIALVDLYILFHSVHKMEQEIKESTSIRLVALRRRTRFIKATVILVGIPFTMLIVVVPIVLLANHGVFPYYYALTYAQFEIAGPCWGASILYLVQLSKSHLGSLSDAEKQQQLQQQQQQLQGIVLNSSQNVGDLNPIRTLEDSVVNSRSVITSVKLQNQSSFNPATTIESGRFSRGGGMHEFNPATAPTNGHGRNGRVPSF